MGTETCTPTDRREWTEARWTFVAAVPGGRGVTAGIDGVFSARYIWKRRFRQQYECCPGSRKRYIWVDGNYDYLLSSLDTLDRDKTFVWKSPLPAGAEGPTPEQRRDIGRAIGLGVTGWWENPKEPAAYRPNDQPTEDDLRLPPRHWFAGAPKAECGQYVLLPNGQKVEWPKLATDPDAGPPDDSKSESGDSPWDGGEPEKPWADKYDDCCKGLTAAQRLPVIRARHAYLTVEAGNWYVTTEFTVTHPCGVDGEPTVEEYVIVPNGGLIHVPKTPGRYRTHQAGNPTHWVVDWSRQQIARRLASGKIGILVKVLATSNCGATTLETFEISK